MCVEVNFNFNLRECGLVFKYVVYFRGGNLYFLNVVI